MTIDSCLDETDQEEIVNYGLNAGLCVIINEHWDGGWMECIDAFTSRANVAEYKERDVPSSCGRI